MSTPTIKPHQVAESFVAVPGIAIETAVTYYPSAASPTTTYATMDDGGGNVASYTINVPVAGRYLVTLFQTYFSSAANEADFRLNFDSGALYVGASTSGSTPPGTPADRTWRVRGDGSSARTEWTLTAFAELSAGSHTVAVEWAYATGTSGTSLNQYDRTKVTLQLLSGSGAGGTLVTQQTLTADFVTPSEDNWHAIPDLSSMSVNCVDETVELSYKLIVGSGGTLCTRAVGYRVDGGSWTVLGNEAANYDTAFAGKVPVAVSAGSHTFDIGVYTDYSSVTVYATAFYGTARPAWAAITQFRGGLVPVQHDGVDVISTPRAFNFQGTSLQIAEENDVVNIGLGPAVTAPGDLIIVSDGPPTSALLVNSGSDHQIMPETGSLAFEAAITGTYMILFSGELIAPSSNSSAQIKLVFDEGEVNEQTVGYTEGWLTRPTTGNYTEPVFKDQVNLTAGSHTVKAYGKIVEGTSIQITTGNVHPLVLTLQAIVGSGAGGVLLATDSLDVDTALTAGSRPPTNVTPGLSMTINCQPGEIIRLVGSGIIESTSALGTWDLRFAVDGIPIRNFSTVAVGVPGAYYGNANFEELFAATSTSHTITLLNSYNGGPFEFKEKYTIWAYQVRGGLVPIREDGVTILDKPAAFNFQGAAIVEDAAGVANIRLPEAITAPGDLIEVTDSGYSITINSDDTYFQFLPGTGSSSISTKVSGTYRVDLIFQLYPSAATPTSFRAKVVFDEGEASELTVGDSDQWTQRVANQGTQYEETIFAGYVTLSAGSHTVKAYCKRIGSGANADIATTTSQRAPQVLLTAVTGSGAGGVLADRVSSTAFPQTITAGFDLGNYDDINDLSTTVEVAEGEQLLITLRAQGLPVTTSSAVGRTRILVGTTPYLVAQVSATTQLDMNLGGSVVTEPLTAGTYTVKAQAANNSTLADIYINLWADMEVTRFRGGLVPILNDSVLIQDKPHAINLLGPGLQAVNLDGKVNVSVNSAAEGTESLHDETIPTTVITANAASSEDYQVPTGASATVTTVEGERLFITFSGSGLATDGSANQAFMSVGLFIDTDLGSTPDVQIGAKGDDTLNQWENLSLPHVTPPLAAGSHTIRVGFRRWDATQPWTLYYSRFQITRFRGGYVVPENVPELVYNTASIVNVAPRAGTSSRLWLLLNDGVRYRADGTLTINLASSGLGGLDTGTEAVSTWYYCYAVPSTTSGEFGVVASVTDPGAGGPTGYAAWKYLGAIRNDSSGDISKFAQNGADFRYYWPVNPADSAALGTTFYTTPINLSVADAVPATASKMAAEARIQRNITGGYTILQKVYADGEPSYVLYQRNVSDSGWLYVSLSGDVVFPTSNKRVQYETSKDGGAVLISLQQLIVHGWTDGYLLGDGSSQTQTEYTPDTPPPRGTWIDATEVDFAAWPGHSSTMRLALSDAKTRIASGTLAVDKANGVADLGYDDASSQGNTKWLYFYAVPKTGDDDQFTVVMSDNDPTVGPIGRSASKYLWSTYINSSGNLLEVTQIAPSYFKWTSQQAVLDGAGTGTPVYQASTHLDLSVYTPQTASAAIMASLAEDTTVRIRQTGKTFDLFTVYSNPSAYRARGGDTPVPLGGSPRGIDYYLDSASGDFWIYNTGWIDAYLAADAGIGAVTGGAGTASPLTTKGDLYTYDTDNQRLPVGSNGQVLTADSAEATGIKWAAISYPTQAYLREETFSTAGTETPGDTVNHVIAATPRAAGTTCGYDIVVHRNGVKLKNVASLTSSYNEFTFTVGTLTVAVLASGDADEYDVDFRS